MSLPSSTAVLLELADRTVDLGDGDILLAADRRIVRPVLEHPARRAQV
jgi:hypothetical protein